RSSTAPTSTLPGRDSFESYGARLASIQPRPVQAAPLQRKLPQRLKRYRCIAIRYDRLAATLLAMLGFAAALICYFESVRIGRRRCRSPYFENAPSPAIVSLGLVFDRALRGAAGEDLGFSAEAAFELAGEDRRDGVDGASLDEIHGAAAEAAAGHARAVHA